MAAGEVSFTIDDSQLQRLVRGMSARAAAGKAALVAARKQHAEGLLEDLRIATPYGEEPHEGEHEHARDGWGIEQHGEDLAVGNRVDHTYFLLHGNHANAADGLIHPTEAAVLHFYDGGSEVFAHGVHPMHADAHLVEAWDHAQHSAETFARDVVEHVMAELRAGLR